MAYPTTIDTYTTHANGDIIDASYDNAQQSTLSALQAKVGIDSSADTASHDYKLSEVTGSDKVVGKSATQTLTNKTLTSPVITTPTINVGSDATGDIYYRNSGGLFSRLAAGTNGYILKLVAGLPSWVAETVTQNASTTVAGISELATSAEITAGTATGSSGAALVVTPDQLAGSAPTFSGVNLTGVVKTSTNYHFTTTVTASANPRGSYSDAASSTISSAQTAYTKFKEIVYADIAGTITATWVVNLVSGGTGVPYTKIYKNGSAVGTERTTTGGQTESGISVSQGDLIQIYAHMTAGDTATYNVDTFRLNYDKATVITTDYATNTVNL